MQDKLKLLDQLQNERDFLQKKAEVLSTQISQSNGRLNSILHTGEPVGPSGAPVHGASLSAQGDAARLAVVEANAALGPTVQRGAEQVEELDGSAKAALKGLHEHKEVIKRKRHICASMHKGRDEIVHKMYACWGALMQKVASILQELEQLEYLQQQQAEPGAPGSTRGALRSNTFPPAGAAAGGASAGTDTHSSIQQHSHSSYRHSKHLLMRRLSRLADAAILVMRTLLDAGPCYTWCLMHKATNLQQERQVLWPLANGYHSTDPAQQLKADHQQQQQQDLGLQQQQQEAGGPFGEFNCQSPLQQQRQQQVTASAVAASCCHLTVDALQQQQQQQQRCEQPGSGAALAAAPAAAGVPSPGSAGGSSHSGSPSLHRPQQQMHQPPIPNHLDCLVQPNGGVAAYPTQQQHQEHNEEVLLGGMMLPPPAAAPAASGAAAAGSGAGFQLPGPGFNAVPSPSGTSEGSDWQALLFADLQGLPLEFMEDEFTGGWVCSGTAVVEKNPPLSVLFLYCFRKGNKKLES